MSSTRKIEVDVLEVESGYMCLRGHDDTRRMEHGFLIIGGKAWTEEEVKAILKDVITAQSDPSQFATRQHGSFLGNWIKAAVSKALATHGITLP